MSPLQALNPDVLFHPVQDAYGTRLALVLGNEHREGLCPFYGHQCFHCDIGAGEGGTFSMESNLARLQALSEHYSSVLPQLDHLILYNSGSILNPREFSRNTLQKTLEWVGDKLPHCQVLSLDSRELYVTAPNVQFVLQHLAPNCQLRVILGLESQSDVLREQVLKKSMSRKGIHTALKVLAKTSPRVGLDVNLVFQPPPLLGVPAIREAVATAEWVLKLATDYGLSLDLNVHPYYPSAIGQKHFPEHPRANLHDAVKALQAIAGLLQTREGSLAHHLFIGWQDEGHDQESGRRFEELAFWQERFARFNASQDPAALDTL